VPHLSSCQPNTDATLESLAEQTHVSLETVTLFYEEEVAALESTATVKAFVEVIAFRRVRDRLRKGLPRQGRGT
jgi:uncharacterized protein DUF3562